MDINDPNDDHFIALAVSAGVGSITFNGGVASRAEEQGVEITLDSNEDANANPSTDTVDLIVRSASSVNFVGKAFVNSFQLPSARVAVNISPTLIFHSGINVRNTADDLPPIFPEPDLSGGFTSLAGRSIGLSQAQVLGIASAVEETQREDETACAEGTAREGEEGESAGGSCAPTAEAEGEELYAIESGPKEAHPAHVD